MRPLRWWAESVPPGGDRAKVSQDLGATQVAPADISLQLIVGLSLLRIQLVICTIIVSSK